MKNLEQRSQLKEHVKMYKAGKVWLFAGIALFAGSGMVSGYQVTANSEPAQAKQIGTDSQHNFDATDGSDTARVNRQGNLGTKGHPTINWSDWQEDDNYSVDVGAKAKNYEANGAKGTVVISNNEPAGSKPDVQSNAGFTYFAVACFYPDGTKARLVDIGIDSPADIPGADVTDPNGNVSHRGQPDFYLDDEGNRTADFSKAVYVGYNAHANDQNPTYYQGGHGVDSGINDKSDISQPGSKATYTFDIHWNAKHIDRLRGNNDYYSIIGSAGLYEGSPKLMKEFYVDAETGNQLAPMRIPSENGHMGQEYNTTNDDLTSQGYWWDNNVSITPDGEQLPLFREVTSQQMQLNPSAIVHYYHHTGKVTARYVNEQGQQLAPDEEQEGQVGQNYKTNAKNIDYFDLKETPRNAEGQYPVPAAKDQEGNTIVTYVYTKTQGTWSYSIDDDSDNGKEIKKESFGGWIDNPDYQSKDYLNKVADDLSSKGYEVLNRDQIPYYLEYQKPASHFVLHVKHKTVDVNPDKPAKPGDKIPGGGANFPDDVSNVEKDVKEIVHYRDQNGKTVAPDAVQTVKAKRTITIDMTNGKVLDQGKWQFDSTDYPTVTSPDVDGMTPDQKQVGSEPVNPELKDSEFVVTYKSNKPANDGGHSGDNTPGDSGNNTPGNNTPGDSGDNTPGNNTSGDSNKNHDDTGSKTTPQKSSDKQSKTPASESNQKAVMPGELPKTGQSAENNLVATAAWLSAAATAFAIVLLGRRNKK